MTEDLLILRASTKPSGKTDFYTFYVTLSLLEKGLLITDH